MTISSRHPSPAPEHPAPKAASIGGDAASLPRRRMLVVLSSFAPLAAACGATSNTEPLPIKNNGDPDITTGGDGGGGGADSGDPACVADGTNVGAVAAFPVNQWTGQDPFIIAHDSNGLYAYTSTCSHQGCSLGGSVDTTTGAVTCPCHQWQYDGNGACITTPSLPLQHFAVSVCDGHVYVDATKKVDASTRTAAS